MGSTPFALDNFSLYLGCIPRSAWRWVLIQIQFCVVPVFPQLLRPWLDFILPASSLRSCCTTWDQLHLLEKLLPLLPRLGCFESIWYVFNVGTLSCLGCSRYIGLGPATITPVEGQISIVAGSFWYIWCWTFWLIEDVGRLARFRYMLIINPMKLHLIQISTGLLGARRRHSHPSTSFKACIYRIVLICRYFLIYWKMKLTRDLSEIALKIFNAKILGLYFTH